MSFARAASITPGRPRPMLPAAHSRGWESLPPAPAHRPGGPAAGPLLACLFGRCGHRPGLSEAFLSDSGASFFERPARNRRLTSSPACWYGPDGKLLPR